MTLVKLIQAELRERGYDARINVVKKNNGVILDEIIIYSHNMNISPVIYVTREMERRFSETEDCVAGLADEILEIWRKNICDRNVDISFFTDFSQAKKAVYPKLVRKENNPVLDDAVAVEYLDLAIVFYVKAAVHSGNASVTVLKKHLNLWDITEDELLKIALKNLFDEELYCRSMFDMLTKDMGISLKEEYSEAPDIYIVTNKQNYFGAAMILNPENLETVSKKLGGDFFILPSSIHEVLCVPCMSDSTGLDAMVSEVNGKSELISAEDVLSDHAYRYVAGIKNIVW